MSTTETISTVIKKDAGGRTYPRPEDLNRLHASLARQIGVFVDAERLSADEAHELVDLHRKVTRPGPADVPQVERFGFSRLTEKERKRWRALVGVAAGEPGLLEAREEDIGLRKQFAELLKKTRPRERLMLEEPGSVRLPREIVFDWLNRPDPILEYAHLGVLVVVLGCLENGRPSLQHGCSVEGEGDARVLVIRRGSDLSKFNPTGRIDTSAALKHLAANGVVTFSETPGERRIGYGQRLLDAWAAAS